MIKPNEIMRVNFKEMICPACGAIFDPLEKRTDLYSQSARLPSGGFSNPLAKAYDVPSGSTAKIDYHFDHGTVFQFCAGGSWHAKAGDRNNYNFTVYVVSR